MRPQQNRRVRGRNNNNGNNNNNRRSPNPLSRNYESSGPDVKIRGNAQQIADKYISLARDAQGAGDRVMSENYLQHAEHYLRIILAAVGQMSQSSRREENSEQECEEIDTEAAKKDDVNYENAAVQTQQKKNGSGQKIKAQNGYADDALDANSLLEEKNCQEQCVAEENDETFKKSRRTSRRRVMRDKEESSLELSQVAEPVSKNTDVSTKKVDSLPLLDEEVQRKPRRRRTAASSLA
ncbi:MULTISPECIES: DUF4167 domain-containing protein [unclassified Bartonella]|uniref:DUF4167 domain-containing protein n=1 Tax=unclassified Bartonella TaxID=2645622 RepID=UPI00300DDD99